MNTANIPSFRNASLWAALAAMSTFSAGAAQPAKTAGGIAIEQAWTRATPPNAPVAGGFLTIRNNGDRADRLVSVTSPDANSVEIHRMTMDDGVMRMRKLADGLPIDAKSIMTLKPGGYHLMFIGPKRPIVEGGTVTATLRFEKAGTHEVRFEVRALGSSGAKPHH
jgi:copper(I)-binding protein